MTGHVRNLAAMYWVNKYLLETDHKPLVPLMSYKLLDNLPPRVLRFRLRFDYHITHVPGKYLYAADALSRAPNNDSLNEEEIKLQEEVEYFIEAVVSHQPVKNAYTDFASSNQRILFVANL